MAAFCCLCGIERLDELELCPHHIESSQNYIPPDPAHDSVREAVLTEWASTEPKLEENEFLIP